MDLFSVKTWGYWLQNINPGKIAESKLDMVVCDTCNSDGDPFTKTVVAKMKANGKLLIAYVSLGEAEDYRWYWQNSWKKTKPKWLGKENPDWPGNYSVKFWEIEWWNITTKILDRLLEQGFDGIYIDKVDVYADLGGTPALRRQMKAYIAKVSSYLKSKNPKFIVISQNGEELARKPDGEADADYLKHVDAIAREDVLFTGDADGMTGPKTPVDEANEVIDDLRMWMAAKKPVFVVEYISGESWAWAKTKHAAFKFVPTSQPRDLGNMRN